MSDRKQATAKVYIEGVRAPIYLAGELDYEHASHAISGESAAYTMVGTTTRGEDIAINTDKVVSVTRVLPVEPPMSAGPEVLYGLQVRIRSAAAVARDDANEPHGDSQVVRDMVPTDDRESYVCIQAEDLAEALVLILGPDFEPVWVNPVVPERAVARYIKVARLVCEAEQLIAEANQPEPVFGGCTFDGSTGEAKIEDGLPLTDKLSTDEVVDVSVDDLPEYLPAEAKVEQALAPDEDAN